ncbi:nicotinate phosphoribosyltransferase [Halomarina salina]|uniref:Nicotinate phosphoribosyltransferase n=1 Tax=Halomarina salina TaxID=1872699 RepID=A0ABD5RLE8_9EURY|nr:nicotinate phosphoribosyltransferase [Halomarina salina]
MFDIVSAEAIREGTATDAYFDRTVAALRHADRDPHVVAEVTADQFPDGEFELFTGVENAAELLSGLPVDVDAIPEGTLFDGGPVMRIEGTYTDFARYETSLLGFLSHASGVATSALEARRAAPDSSLLSFGARHVHPAIATMIERSALVGGFDGFSHVAAGEHLDREASGTMPHALVICFGPGEQEAAWTAFDEASPEGTPRIALCDTYTDETDESLRAAETIDLDGVRLDTTGSRRGDFRHIVREVRWKLDDAGYDDVEVFCSGGLGPDELRELRDVADGFGVGGFVSNADPIDFALDIVEVAGERGAKRGKLPGPKAVYRTADGEHLVLPADDDAPEDAESLLEPLVRDGEVVADFDVDAAAERAARDAERVGFATGTE